MKRVVPLLAVAVLVGALAAPALAADISVSAAAATSAMAPDASSQTPRSATCGSGATLIGGGIRLVRTADSSLPTNGLKVNGTVPSNVTGAPVGNGTLDPTTWTALGGFAAVGETGDTVTGFALCATGGPAHTQVVVNTTAGPSVAATTKAVTATCPGGSSLVGGGGMSNNATIQPSFKIIGSYPSDASGRPLANGATTGQSWTVVGAAGGVGGFGGAESNQTTVFAVCATDVAVPSVVSRVDLADRPEAATTAVTATTTCPSGTTLLSGGMLADGIAAGLDGGVPQQGVHLRGSFPSDASGNPVANGASGLASWSAIVQSGGQVTPGTDTHVFALCVTGTAAPSSGGGGSGGGAAPAAPGSAGSGETGEGSAQAAAATTVATVSKAGVAATRLIVSPGARGAVKLGSAATVAWSANGLAPSSVTLQLATQLDVGKGKSSHTGTTLVEIGVKGATGKTMRALRFPLDVSFAGAAGNVVPAFTLDGKTWTRIPALDRPTLPVGFRDGWFRDRLGTLHILTLRAVSLALLKQGAKAATPLALGYRAASLVSAGEAGRGLAVTIQATRPAAVALRLVRGGRTLRTWHERAGASPRTLQLELPAAALRGGVLRLELVATAGDKRAAAGGEIRVR